MMSTGELEGSSSLWSQICQVFRRGSKSPSLLPVFERSEEEHQPLWIFNSICLPRFELNNGTKEMQWNEKNHSLCPERGQCCQKPI